MTLSPDERFVYVGDLQDAVAIFARNPRSGGLTQLPGTAGCISETGADGCATARGIYGSHRVTITRDGRSAYLAGKRGGKGGSTLAVFSRNPATGALRQLPGPAGCFTEDGSDGCAVGRSPSRFIPRGSSLTFHPFTFHAHCISPGTGKERRAPDGELPTCILTQARLGARGEVDEV